MENPEPPASVSDAEFRHALGGLASGITVITANCDSPIGMTCQSFFSVSLRPPLVAFAVNSSSDTYPGIRSHGSFCVNVLSATQAPLSSQFASKGVDRWAGVTWNQSPLGNPIIDGSLAWIDCWAGREFEVGDHWLVLGHVANVDHETDRQPLLYFRSAYAELALQELGHKQAASVAGESR